VLYPTKSEALLQGRIRKEKYKNRNYKFLQIKIIRSRRKKQ